jgi:hypothetical protein
VSRSMCRQSVSQAADVEDHGQTQSDPDRCQHEIRPPTSAGGQPGSNARDEAVTVLGKSLDVERMLGGVIEGLTDLLDGFVEPLVKVHEGVVRPEAAAQFLAGDELAGTFQEGGEHLEGLFLEVNLTALLADFSRLKVSLESSETDQACGGRLGYHGSAPPFFLMAIYHHP